MSTCIAFLQTPSCAIMPMQSLVVRFGGAGMVSSRGKSSWLTRLRPALRGHAQRFVHLVGLDGMREIGNAIPPALPAHRPSIDRTAELMAALHVYLTEPGAEFQAVVKQMVIDGRIVPKSADGDVLKDMGPEGLPSGFAKDLGRRLRGAVKADPDFERRAAEDVAKQGFIVREDLYPDIHERQFQEIIKRASRPLAMSATPDPFQSTRDLHHSIDQQMQRKQAFRQAFADLLPERITVGELNAIFLAAHAFIRADIETKQDTSDS